MTMIEGFRMLVEKNIKADRAEINRAVEDIKSRVESDPIAFAYSIELDARRIGELAKEIAEYKDVMNMLSAIEDDNNA